MKKCKYCAELIPEDAKICPYCSARTDSENISDEDSGERNNDGRNFLVKFLSLCIIVASVYGAALFGKNYLKRFSPDIPLSRDTVIDQKYSYLPKTGGENFSNIEEARAFIDEKEYDKAAEILDKELKGENAAYANYYMAEIYRNRGYKKLAIKTYKTAENYDSKLYEPKIRLAEMYRSSGDFDSALKYASEASKLNPDETELLQIIAEVYYKQDDIPKTVKTLKEIVKADNTQKEALSFLSAYYFNRKDYEEAIEYLNNLLNIDYNTETASALAYSYAMTNRNDHCKDILDKIAQSDADKRLYALAMKENIEFFKEEYEKSLPKFSEKLELKIKEKEFVDNDSAPDDNRI